VENRKTKKVKKWLSSEVSANSTRGICGVSPENAVMLYKYFFGDLVDLCRVLAEFHGGGCHTGAQPRGVV